MRVPIDVANLIRPEGGSKILNGPLKIAPVVEDLTFPGFDLVATQTK